MYRPPTLFCCHPSVWKSQDHYYFRALSMFWVAFVPLLVLPSPGVPLTAPIGAPPVLSAKSNIFLCSQILNDFGLCSWVWAHLHLSLFSFLLALSIPFVQSTAQRTIIS